MAFICLRLSAYYPEDFLVNTKIVIVGETQGEVREKLREILYHLLLAIEGKKAVAVPVAIGIAADDERAVGLRLSLLENVGLFAGDRGYQPPARLKNPRILTEIVPEHLSFITVVNAMACQNALEGAASKGN